MTIPKYCILCENYKQHPCRCTHCEDFDEFIVSESGKHLILTMNKQYEQEKIKELEQIKEKIEDRYHKEMIKRHADNGYDYQDLLLVGIDIGKNIVVKHIYELKGE